jgi:hypothetical protein
MIEVIRPLAMLHDNYHPEDSDIDSVYLRGVILGKGTPEESQIDLELDVEYLVTFPKPVEYQFGNVVFAQGTLDVDDDGLKLVHAKVTYEGGKTKSNGEFYIALSQNPIFSRVS